MQRNFIANWLENTGKGADAALVAFYGDDQEDWRFSFVKMEYNLVRDETGNVKVSKESREALLEACLNKLPKKPPTQIGIAGMEADYNQETGVVQVKLSPEKAQELGSFLVDRIKWVALGIDLKNAHKAHVDFHNEDKEPGVDEGEH